MLRLAALSGTLLALAAGAASAHAATLCVHSVTPCSPGALDKGDDLQAAIESAEATFAADVIEIGPGSYQGPFEHQFGTGLELRGSGAGITQLVGGPGDPATIRLGGADISDMTIQVKGAALAKGIVADHDAHIRDVAVYGAPIAGGVRTGIELNDGASMLEASVAMPGPDDRALATGNESKNRYVTRATLQAAEGVVVKSGNTKWLTVSQSTITSPAPAVAEAGRLALNDTVVEGAFAVGLRARCTGADAYINGRNLTIVGNGAGAGVKAECGTAGSETDVVLESSVVDGVGAPWIRTAVGGADSDVHLRWSNLRGEPFASGPGESDLQNVLDVPSGFADDGRHLAPDSPLRDAGDPAVAGGLDRDGRPRVQNGRVDIGAYELDPPPPGAQPPAAGGGGGTTGGGTGEALPQPPALTPAKKAVTRAALLRELRRTLRGRKGRLYRHRWRVPGTLRIKWIAPGGQLVASMRVQRKATGTRRMRVVATKRGRSLLRTARRVTVRASFTPRGGRAVRASRGARLRS